MNNLITLTKNEIGIWEEQSSIVEIKKVFAPTLTNEEFSIFVQMGRATGLNPYLREIWAVKYKSKDTRYPDPVAQIFIGRDGYRKSAQRHPDYDYHESFAVYENDSFEVLNGTVNHKFNLKNRGTLIGAYCIVKRKRSSKPVCNYVPLSEYCTDKSLWKPTDAGGKRDTMIKKVAEAQGLKANFQELFANTYNEYEQYKEPESLPETGKGTEDLAAALGIELANDPIVIAESLVESPPTDLLQSLKDLMAEKNIGPGTISKWLMHFKIQCLEELSSDEIHRLINKINENQGNT